MLFLKKLQNEKRAKERRKKRGQRKRGDRLDEEIKEKKSRFDVENLQKVELTDEDLKLIMQILDEQDVKSEMMKSTREDPDPKKKNDVDESLPTSISNVTVAVSNYDFRHESIVRRLEMYGFDTPKVRDVVTRVTKELSSDASAQQIERLAFVSHLLAQPPTDQFEDVDALDEEERKDANEDEIMVLESILGEDKIVRDETQDRWCVTVDDVEIPDYLRKQFHVEKLEEEEEDTSTTLEIWFPFGTEYPCTPPRFYVRDNRLPRDLCLEISRGALTCSLSCVGSPCVYSVVTWLQENMLSVVKDWIENVKKKKSESSVSPPDAVVDLKQEEEVVVEEKKDVEDDAGKKMPKMVGRTGGT